MRTIKSLSAVIPIITALFLASNSYAETKTYEVYGTLTIPDGTPAPGVELTVFLDSCKMLKVTTDSNGGYKVTCEGYPYWIRAEYLDYVLHEALSVPEDTTGPVQKDLKLEYACLVLGEVIDAATGAPLADANVDIHRGYNIQKKTGEDGVFKIRVPRRSGLEMVVGKNGYVTHRMIFDAQNISTTAWRMPLKPAGIVKGIVTDQNGQPVAGTEVLIVEYGMHGRYFKTDTTGHYEIPNVDTDIPASISVSDTRLPRRETKSVTFAKGSKEAVCNFAVKLEGRELMTITGRVIDTNGVSVVGAKVFFGQSSYQWNKTGITTDSLGDYTLAGVTKSRDMIMIQAEGYAPGFMPVEDTGDQRIDVVLKPAHSAQVLVVDPDGQPIPEAAVTVNARTPVHGRLQGDFVIDGDVYRSLYSTKTNSDGKVTLNDLPEYGAVIDVDYGGFITPDNMAIRVDVDDNVIRMERTPQIAGVVIDAETGKPLQRFTVKWMTEGAYSDGGDYNSVFTRPDGKFTTTVRGGGNYTVRVLADGYVGEVKIIKSTDSPNPDYSNTFKLQKAYATKGRVVDSAGKGIAGADVTVVEYRGYMDFKIPPEVAPNCYQQKYTTAPDGSFTINPVREKTAVLIVEKQGYTKLVDKTVDISKPFELKLIEPVTLKIKAASLAGPGCTVRLTHVKNHCYRSLPSQNLPEDGNLVCSDLEDGDYIIHIGDKKHGEMRSCSLKPGEETTIDIDQPRPVTIRGRVTADGVPAPDISVGIQRGLNEYYSSSTSDSQGNYEIHIDYTGDVEVRLSKPEGDQTRCYRSIPVVLKSGDNVVDVKIPTGSVSGKLVDAQTGQPLEGEIVEIMGKWPPLTREAYDRFSIERGYGESLGTTKTAKDGSFAIDGLPDEPVLLTVTTQHQRMKYISNLITVSEKKPITGMEIKMPAQGALQVVIVDAHTGKDLGPMSIMLYTKDGLPVFTDNRYNEGTNVPAGKFTMWVDPPGDKYLPTYADIEVISGKSAKATIKLKPAGQKLVFRVPKGGALENLRWPDKDTKKYKANALEEKEDIFKARPWIGYSLSDAKTGKSVLLGPLGPRWGDYISGFNTNREATLPIKPGKYILDAVLRNTDDYSVDSKNNLWHMHREVTITAGKDTIIMVK